MKKSLALLAIATLLVGTNGCGCCRGLFGKSSPAVAAPVFSQCAPSCAPTCSTAPSCGCEGGTPVTYGFDGSSQVPYSPAVSYESTPMTFPTGSGTFGQ